MSRLLQKVASIGFLSLLLLWSIGLFVAPPEPASVPSQVAYGFNREDFSRQQVANNLRTLRVENVPLPLLLDRPEADGIRIHEKSAQLTASTAAFDHDEKEVRLAAAGHDALVLNERSSGIDGQRRLALEISVRPERFDDLTKRLRTIGRLETVSVHQRDRTDEFRRLRGQQQRLKQQREAVEKVRGGKEPSAEDQLRILQKLYEIDKELQTVADQAGDLLGKESYYHVYLTLTEESPDASAHHFAGFPRRAGRALVWALPWWCVTMAMIGLLPGIYASVRAFLPSRSQRSDPGAA